jgi:hypothetical protein
MNNSKPASGCTGPSDCSQCSKLRSALDEAAQLLHRYRTETPPGYQPHMIADKVDHWLIANAVNDASAVSR